MKESALAPRASALLPLAEASRIAEVMALGRESVIHNQGGAASSSCPIPSTTTPLPHSGNLPSLCRRLRA